MFAKLLRILFGFALACLAGGLAMVLFVFTPSEIAGLPPDVAGDRLGKSFELAAVVAVQAALFSAPFALVAVAMGEALRNRDWTYYVIAGLIIAGIGFFAQHSTEQTGQPTIVNNYALTAFLTSGFVAGMMYWILSGRFAGGRHVQGLAERQSVPADQPVVRADAAAKVDAQGGSRPATAAPAPREA